MSTPSGNSARRFGAIPSSSNERQQNDDNTLMRSASAYSRVSRATIQSLGLSSGTDARADSSSSSRRCVTTCDEPRINSVSAFPALPERRISSDTPLQQWMTSHVSRASSRAAQRPNN